MTTASPREILLYGMSANPIVGAEGHLGAVAHCRALGFDEVWLLPVYQHIYSSKRGLAPFDDRVAMCQLAVDALDPLSHSAQQSNHKGQVFVKPYERELFEHLAQTTDKPDELRVGSIDLVRYLTQRFPDAAFTMLLGGDTFADLQTGKWKSGDELKRLVKLLVMTRQGYDAPDTTTVAACERDRIRFITIPSLSDISSTYVRAITDEVELRRCVAPKVAEYIMDHKLYGFSA